MYKKCPKCGIILFPTWLAGAGYSKCPYHEEEVSSMKKIAKPSEIEELDIRPVSELEIKFMDNVPQHLPELASYVHQLARDLYFLRRDYDHLHAVVETMLD